MFPTDVGIHLYFNDYWLIIVIKRFWIKMSYPVNNMTKRNDNRWRLYHFVIEVTKNALLFVSTAPVAHIFIDYWFSVLLDIWTKLVVVLKCSGTLHRFSYQNTYLLRILFQNV